MSYATNEPLPDKLPPHSEQAEQGVLGCILLSPVECMEECLRKMRAGPVVFYDERHKEIFRAMLELADLGIPIDLITLPDCLKKRGRLEEIGGLQYLAGLPDTVPSAANISYYITIVLENYFLRQMVQVCTSTNMAIMAGQKDSNQLLEEADARLAQLGELRLNAMGEDVAPQYLKTAEDFSEGAYARFFRNPQLGDPGLILPLGDFPFRIRPKEVTLVSADDGAGKSTVLSYFLLHLAHQLNPGEKVCVASFEEPADVSLWRIMSQLIGQSNLPETEEGKKKYAAALGWVNKRFRFYDFLGISDWRDVLAAFRYEAEHNQTRLFLLDSVMRIGIPDDDYAQQGFASAAFSKFAMDTDSHLFVVIHENKSDAKGKGRVRGSKLWTANAHNVTRVERNMSKADKVAELETQISGEQAALPPPEKAELRKQAEDYLKELTEDLAKTRALWDTLFALLKQRYPGTRQNGIRRFWYEPFSFQFPQHYGEGRTNWLEKWREAKDPQMEISTAE